MMMMMMMKSLVGWWSMSPFATDTGDVGPNIGPIGLSKKTGNSDDCEVANAYNHWLKGVLRARL